MTKLLKIIFNISEKNMSRVSGNSKTKDPPINIVLTFAIKVK